MGAILDKLKSFSPGIASTEIQEERITICKACDHYVKSTTTCKKCGCFMSIKKTIKDINCPIGKW